jgi:hypothetical protein
MKNPVLARISERFDDALSESSEDEKFNSSEILRTTVNSEPTTTTSLTYAASEST